MEEEFRVCTGHNNYSVSNFGRVRNNKTNKIIKGSLRKGYLRIDYVLDGSRTCVPIHRLVSNAFIPNPEDKPLIDHIDNNTTNNNAYNLRWCTSSENQQNRGVHKNNSTGTKGVYFRKDMKDKEGNLNWRAMIMHNGKSIKLGSFKTKEEALYARKKKANELFGLFVHSIEKLEEVIVELKMEALKIDTD
jgi:hypothetical protein